MGIQKYKNNFKFTQHNSEVELPLRWKKPRKIFVNSMSDLFHEEAEMEFIARCFDTMTKASWHIYQILTKRPTKMAEFSKLFNKFFEFQIPNNIWMGTSVEDNQTTWRINELREVKCYTRFVSFEPLLENINKVNLSNIDWAIIGGESGHHYRRVEKEWVQNLIKQCQKQNVKVFFKQWGGFRPKAGGRKINGRTYSGYPKVKPITSKRQAMKIESIKNEDVKFKKNEFKKLLPAMMIS